jgi:hypothetical protein
MVTVQHRGANHRRHPASRPTNPTSSTATVSVDLAAGLLPGTRSELRRSSRQGPTPRRQPWSTVGAPHHRRAAVASPTPRAWPKYWTSQPFRTRRNQLGAPRAVLHPARTRCRPAARRPCQSTSAHPCRQGSGWQNSPADPRADDARCVRTELGQCLADSVLFSSSTAGHADSV